MGDIEELEIKIRGVVERVAVLKKENQQLRAEYESLKAHMDLLNNENTKAQRIIAEYEQVKRRQEQVTHRVERALNALGTLKTA